MTTSLVSNHEETSNFDFLPTNAHLQATREADNWCKFVINVMWMDEIAQIESLRLNWHPYKLSNGNNDI